MGIDKSQEATLRSDAQVAYLDLKKGREAYKEAGVEQLPGSLWMLVVRLPDVAKSKRKNRAQFIANLQEINKELNGRAYFGTSKDSRQVFLLDFHAGVADLERALWERIVRLQSWLNDLEGVETEWVNSNRVLLHPESVIPELPYPEAWQRCEIESLPYEARFLEMLRQQEGRFGFKVYNSGTTIIVERLEGATAPRLFTEVQLYNLISQLARQVGSSMPIKVAFDPEENPEEARVREVLAMPLNPTTQEVSLEFLSDPIGEFLQELLARAHRRLASNGIQFKVTDARQLIRRALAESPELLRDLRRSVFSRAGPSIGAELEAVPNETIVHLLIDHAEWIVRSLERATKLGMPYLRWVRKQISEGVARRESVGMIQSTIKDEFARRAIVLSPEELSLLEVDVSRFYKAYETPKPLAGYLMNAVDQWVELYKRENPKPGEELREEVMESAENCVGKPFYETHAMLFEDGLFRVEFFRFFKQEDGTRGSIYKKIGDCVKVRVRAAFGFVDAGAEA